MKRIFIAILVLACASCSKTKTTVTEILLPSGDTVVLKVRATPGFLDPSIERTYFVHWAKGKKEKLPFLLHLYPDKSLRAAETNDAVFLTTDHGAVVRSGTKTKVLSDWYIWTIQPSDELYQYLESFAESTGNQNVGFTTYTCPQRTGPMTVHATAIETNKTIRFQDTDYFFSPTRHTGWWLPHRLESIDFNEQVLTFHSPASIPSMPEYLVFVGHRGRHFLEFSPERTTKKLQQEPGEVRETSSRPSG